MPKFELGFAFRGTTAPEVKKVVEADSMREAMINLVDDHGGDAVVVVTQAHYFHAPEPQPPRYGYCLDLCSGATPFMLATH